MGAEDQSKYEMPNINDVDPEEFVPKKRIPNEVKQMHTNALEEVSESNQPNAIKAKHFKMGSVDIDEQSTDMTGFSPGMMTAEEMTAVQARLEGPWKDLPDSKQKKKIREYLLLRRSREKNPH